MMELEVYVNCDHTGCQSKDTAKLPFEGFENIYADGAYVRNPKFGKPTMPSGWRVGIPKNFWSQGASTFCPEHAGEHLLEKL